MTAGDRLFMTGADPRLLSGGRKKSKKEREVSARSVAGIARIDRGA